ncbi:exodeoxyribonuclease VII small subunit [Arthrobacter crystallopoietes]|uniref:Exodeoxyribonuclease 7 small subunit n=1 Tax=Crystallibacter crystallopoietes TaxID=37928 RepID=A0A1H1F9I2_9MICC|nr:exodeoxyribonuclease VII small subunit [Arthrobacter crystallopoietes]SDQ97601.1 Exodeoxyribonuclease VII small subunit [Arthrobacter crystallopoietes]
MDAKNSVENADVASLSYEQAREELVAVVSQLETGGASLEQSLALWERGEALAARCEAWLEGARQRLDAARADAAGGPAATGMAEQGRD